MVLAFSIITEKGGKGSDSELPFPKEIFVPF